ncbi:GlxA family transcriptional regulator [Arcicella rosea]|uniref:Transcriptional regulator GlxA family with amidase domain n=1 Tax=Arcicella rosea TaxID=502909 RepID=A0A841EFS0_9BACT|nr:helix-turn-helix domain-containing protein [Arcicella rosea]MBB6003037.1 transcriptional regulator GlxA family with amidase domain [Arcicella rosea]
MKKVAILIPEHSTIHVVAISRFMFETVNQFLISSGREKLFDIKLVGQQKQMQIIDGPFMVTPDLLINEVDDTDLIIIPPMAGNMQEGIWANKNSIDWIITQHQKGSEVASLCVGAFLLASTGLVNGKKCSTHWGFNDEFRTMFPEVILQDGKIVTDEDGIYSSGGANSCWNLLLYLIEKYVDRETAILTSKYFAIDIDRTSQSSFAMFKGQKEHKDDAIRKIQTYIESNIEEKFTVEDLAEKVALGRRSFERRFKLATNNSVLEYIQRVKIEAAKRSIESSRKNINEVMFDVGYTDTKAFRTTFKKITGLSPVEYKNKYNKIATD